MSNLINMMAEASHDYLVIADSDVRVDVHYLAKIVIPLMDSGVGSCYLCVSRRFGARLMVVDGIIVHQ